MFNADLPYLIFSELKPETHIYFLGLSNILITDDLSVTKQDLLFNQWFSAHVFLLILLYTMKLE